MFNSVIPNAMTLSAFLMCIFAALVLGVLTALVFSFRNKHSGSLILALAVLPPIVTLVIMMVNGNIGAGLAVAGTFSLVRFRSAAGTGREISAVFIAMGAGLIAGMGYLTYAVLFALLLGIMMMAYTAVHLGVSRRDTQYRQLRITIPESLNYEHVFDPVLESYTSQYALRHVKTTNMGSLFRLTYDVTLRQGLSGKQLLDELRCLNGNLEISLSCQELEGSGL